MIDDEKDAIRKNPCGVCRARGMPVCKGHGGGGDETEEESDDQETPRADEYFYKTPTPFFSAVEDSPVGGLSTMLKKMNNKQMEEPGCIETGRRKPAEDQDQEGLDDQKGMSC